MQISPEHRGRAAARRPTGIAAVCVLAACGVTAAQFPRIDSAAFEQRIQSYLQLRGAAAAQAGRPHVADDPQHLTTTVDDLARNIQGRRAAAREGDIFSPDIATVFREALAAVFGAPGAGSLRETIQEVQPRMPPPAVNARYPDAQPHATMPPQVLAVLPRLPDQLSFRFVGRDLLLIDRNTALIVDILRNALPPPGRGDR